jgi:RNA polymerase sigma factor (sigma-70 family)
MVSAQVGKVLRHLQGALHRGQDATDRQLLERFVLHRDEIAFESLVRCHGPMVFGVCRRVLGNVHDAEDAFQVTFLILARKAASLRQRGAVGSFLHGVAYRAAMQAKRASARRRAREACAMPQPDSAEDIWGGLREVLDEELGRLPEKYRAPLVLCDLEGRTRKEAARQLGLPEGTVASRQARGRRLLAQRLTRHGLSLSGGALAVTLSKGVAAVPASLLGATVQAAGLLAAGQAAAVATPAAALMNEVLKTMFLTKLKLGVAATMVAVLCAAGSLVYRAAGQAAPPQPREVAKPRTEVEALRREVELLRFNLELVLEKCRAQETELRTLRAGRDAAALNAKEDVAKLKTLLDQQQAASAREAAKLKTLLDQQRYAADVAAAQAQFELVYRNVLKDPTQDIEAALKAFREAPNNEAKQRAAEALEKALKKLRQQLKPTDSSQPQQKSP